MALLAEIARLRAKKRCRKFSVLLMESLATGNTISVYRVPCKSWACVKCAKKKAMDISTRAEMAFGKETVRFISLTIRPAATIAAGLIAINQAWNRLRGKIVRRWGKVKYLKVLENQRKTKMPHFHILVNKWIDRDWLQQAAIESGFGWHVDIRIVKDRGVLCYVLKYLKKGIMDDDFFTALLSMNGRRFGFSRGMYPPSQSTKYGVRSFLKTQGHNATATWLFMCGYMVGGIEGYVPLESDDGWSRWFSQRKDALLLPAPS